MIIRVKRLLATNCDYTAIQIQHFRVSTSTRNGGRCSFPMLPSPSVASFQRRTRLTASPRRKFLDTLARRSRLTNLGVFILAFLCVISLLINLRQWALPPSLEPLSTHGLAFSTVNWPATRKNFDHLVVVPCHSIWQGTYSWLDEKDWLLEPYQKGPGRVRAFYQHIERRYF